MIELEFNDTAARAALNRLALALDDMTEPLQDIADHLRDSTKDRIADGVSPDGTPFAPRSQATLDAYEAKKKKNGDAYGSRPLWRSGTMRNFSIHSSATATAAEIGSNAIQAAMMHFGGKKSEFPRLWGDIPARPFIGASSADTENVLDIVLEWLGETAQTG